MKINKDEDFHLYDEDTFNELALEADEKTIRDPKFLFEVAQATKERLGKEFEDLIRKKHPRVAALYAVYVIRGVWKNAEPYILNDATASMWYATGALDKRWLKAERTIKLEARVWEEYSRHFSL